MEEKDRDEKGLFKKGHNGGGRPKGSENKVTIVIKERFQDLANDNLDNIQTWLDEVAENDPGRALDLFLKLSEYVIPKLARTESKIDITEHITGFDINIISNDDDEEQE